jgi:hypothetical protein
VSGEAHGLRLQAYCDRQPQASAKSGGCYVSDWAELSASRTKGHAARLVSALRHTVNNGHGLLHERFKGWMPSALVRVIERLNCRVCVAMACLNCDPHVASLRSRLAGKVSRNQAAATGDPQGERSCELVPNRPPLAGRNGLPTRGMFSPRCSWSRPRQRQVRCPLSASDLGAPTPCPARRTAFFWQG